MSSRRVALIRSRSTDGPAQGCAGCVSITLRSSAVREHSNAKEWVADGQNLATLTQIFIVWSRTHAGVCKRDPCTRSDAPSSRTQGARMAGAGAISVGAAGANSERDQPQEPNSPFLCNRPNDARFGGIVGRGAPFGNGTG